MTYNIVYICITSPFQLQTTPNCKDFILEQNEPASSLLVPSSTTQILSESAADNAENVSAAAFTLPSLSPTSLPLSDAAIQCGNQSENQQLLNGKLKVIICSCLWLT